MLAVDTPAFNVWVPRQTTQETQLPAKRCTGIQLTYREHSGKCRSLDKTYEPHPTRFSHTDPTENTEQSTNLARSTKPANHVEAAQATCVTLLARTHRDQLLAAVTPAGRSVYCTSPLTPLRLYAARLLAPFFLELRRTPLWAFLALPFLVVGANTSLAP